MVSVQITPSTVQGTISIPPSKSHTLRSIIFSLMAKGKSRITHPLPSPDVMAMLDAARFLGAKIDMDEDTLFIDGVAGKLHPAEDVIQCGNSGQVLRFIAALAALSDTYTILTGDPSIRHNRPVMPLLDGLTQLGAFATTSRLDGYAPIIVKGPLKNTKASKIAGEDSQPISALLILGAFFPLELEVNRPGEKPWIDLTLNWLTRMGVSYENHQYERYIVKGGKTLDSFDYQVPGDWSSAAFPIAAALLSCKELMLENIDMSDVQGDKAIIQALEKMGAKFEIEGLKLHVKKHQGLKGIRININDFVDALPILSVIACFAEGKTVIEGAAIARAKESDRIACITKELKKMGANIEETKDGVIIEKSHLQGVGNLEAHHDHRLAMSLTIAAMHAENESVIQGMRCVSKTYPTFFEDLRKIGAQIQVI